MRVIIALSGGVDSAVSAALLKHAARPDEFEKLTGRPTPKGFSGAQVVGAFIKTWHPDWLENRCGWREERRDAMRVAAALDIPFVTVDLEQEYKKSVADYMIAEYKAGRTPNPDVCCNKEIKFGAFLDNALALGADMIATGHYAQIIQNSKDKSQNYNFKLKMGEDRGKDQSYFLWTLTQEQLAKIIFPVGHLHKSEVRELARKFKIPVAEKRDSQGICFLGNVDMKDFLGHYIETKTGDVLDQSGKVIGRHDGAIFYTLGQTWHRPLYVIAKDMNKNTITVTERSPTPPRQTRWGKDTIILKDINWIDPNCKLKIENRKIPELAAQLRYHGERIPCVVGDNKVALSQPALAAPGQSVVFYSGEECLGGGVVVE